MAYKRVQFLKGARVEQLLEPLSRGVLALRVLLVDRLLGAGVDRLVLQLLKLGQFFLIGLGRLVTHRGAECKANGSAA